MAESNLRMPHHSGITLQTSATIQDGLAAFTPVSTDLSGGQDLNPPGESTEDLHLGQQQLEWWDLTFAEAGFAHFEGLDPLSGFWVGEGMDSSRTDQP